MRFARLQNREQVAPNAEECIQHPIDRSIGETVIPGLEGVEFLPEPEDPRMLSTIDPGAPGYPAEAYGMPSDMDPQAWKEADAV